MEHTTAVENTIIAVYENGVLRPLTPLALPEHTRVQVHVQQISAPTDAAEHRRQVQAALVAAGLSLPNPSVSPVLRPLSEERREELAYLFAGEQSLSELIIKEREGR